MKKYLGKLLISSIFLTGVSLCADNSLPQPFASIQQLPYIPYFVQDAYVFYSLIDTYSSAVIVDVESQGGGVARYIAQQSANLTSVKQVYAINGWYSADPTYKHLFQLFLSNVIQENTAALITPIRMTSQDAALGTNIQADFISLVGGNEEGPIYRDILAWYPHLNSNGVICGNNWNENSVQNGVTKAATALDLTVKINDNVWYFVKQ